MTYFVSGTIYHYMGSCIVLLVLEFNIISSRCVENADLVRLATVCQIDMNHDAGTFNHLRHESKIEGSKKDFRRAGLQLGW